jgi:hypothetical protein
MVGKANNRSLPPNKPPPEHAEPEAGSTAFSTRPGEFPRNIFTRNAISGLTTPNSVVFSASSSGLGEGD